jgi:hypothetical protein
MCCLIPDTPVEDSKGRIKTFNTPNKFQVIMVRFALLCPRVWFDSCLVTMPMSCVSLGCIWMIIHYAYSSMALMWTAMFNFIVCVCPRWTPPVLMASTHSAGSVSSAWASPVAALRYVMVPLLQRHLTVITLTLVLGIFAQYALRRKVLNDDMTKYQCCQGYINCCCFKAGMCGEENCPDLCLCIEACLCNGFAVSSSRMYVMDMYQLSSDPCDYRLIRINNCLQVLSCICHILAAIHDAFALAAQIVDRIADLVYHIVSGCMTAQVSSCVRICWWINSAHNWTACVWLTIRLPMK